MDSSTARWDDLEAKIVNCRLCPRLVAWREEVARTRRRAYRDWVYWGKPVPGFGDRQARVLVVGLAPGAHGANRTGRMFTGDGSGEFLYRALYKAGFANQPEGISREDGLELSELFITAVCRCVPPANKPKALEISTCLPYMKEEMKFLTQMEGIVALGGIAFDYTLRILRESDLSIPRLKFTHGGLHQFDSNLPWVIASYHPSRQNTQTGRLTEEMFDEIWGKVRSLL